jgi:DNA-binding NarL/FixJ family response regulator
MVSSDVADPDVTPLTEPVIRVGILLVKDRVLLASSLAVVLNLAAGLRVVAVGTDPSHVNRVIAAAEVVLVDDIPLAAQIHALEPDVRLIVLGSTKDRATLLACIRAGASSWIDKDFLPEQLIDVIQRARAGEILYDPAALVRLLLDPSRRAPGPPQRTATLGERELQVLEVIAAGHSSTRAAEQLGISQHTVRTHIKNIIAKMGARSKLEAVVIAIREGRIHFD